MKLVATILALAFHVAVVLGDGPFGFMSEFYERVEAPLNNLQNQLRSRFVPTLWCGVRNAAPIPDALSAVYPHLDNCCREHDQCPMIIKRGECFEGLCNPSFLKPILHCDCEEQFRNCLKSLPSATSLPLFPVKWSERVMADLTGVGYFGVVPQLIESKCLKEGPPIVNCLVWNAKEHKCEEFEPAKNGTVNWQLVPVYDNFNARDWFQPKKYANDVVDVETIMEGKRRFFLGSE